MIALDPRDVEQIVHEPNKLIYLAFHHVELPEADLFCIGPQKLDPEPDRSQRIAQLMR